MKLPAPETDNNLASVAASLLQSVASGFLDENSTAREQHTYQLPDTTKTVLARLSLSLATGPLLLFIIGTEAVMARLIEWGQASEELLRGDLLPNIPSASPDANRDR